MRAKAIADSEGRTVGTVLAGCFYAAKGHIFDSQKARRGKAYI